jgi:hypothetical protein
MSSGGPLQLFPPPEIAEFPLRFQSACACHFVIQISGFEMGEIDVAFEGSGSDEEDDLPALKETSTPVTKPGETPRGGGILIQLSSKQLAKPTAFGALTAATETAIDDHQTAALIDARFLLPYHR